MADLPDLPDLGDRTRGDADPLIAVVDLAAMNRHFYA